MYTIQPNFHTKQIYLQTERTIKLYVKIKFYPSLSRKKNFDDT